MILKALYFKLKKNLKKKNKNLKTRIRSATLEKTN